jgi:hypothetical protein
MLIKGGQHEICTNSPDKFELANSINVLINKLNELNAFQDQKHLA